VVNYTISPLNKIKIIIESKVAFFLEILKNFNPQKKLFTNTKHTQTLAKTDV
jgi:hypothetical protein